MKLNYCILFFLFAVYHTDLFANQKKYQKDVNYVDKKIKAITQQLNQQKKEIKSHQHQIYLLDKKIFKNEKEITVLAKKADMKKEELRETNKHLEKIQDDHNQLKKKVMVMARQQYITGKINYPQMLLNQKNPYQVGRLDSYYLYYQQAYREKIAQIKILNEHFLSIQKKQKKLIKEVTGNKELMTVKNQQLNQAKQSRKKILDVAFRGVTEKKDKLSQLKRNRKRLLTLIKKLKIEAERLAKIEQERKKREQQEAQVVVSPAKKDSRLLVGSFAQQKNKLSYPVKGSIKYRFGQSLKASGLVSEGIFFDTNNTQKVHAIFSGKVVFSDILKGYGLLLIIDHGGGYISLYGHNDVLYKKIGDNVKTNEVISKSGVSGGLKSSGLYFEIRQNATPINPSKWIR